MRIRCLLHFFVTAVVLLSISLDSNADKKLPFIKGDPRNENPPVDTTVSGNMVVTGVPDEFMQLIADYIKLSSNDVPHPEYDEYRKSEAQKIVKKIRADYAKDAEGYFVKMAKHNRSPYIRTCAYNLFFKLNDPNGEMLSYAREALQKIPWEDGQHLNQDIGHQMRVVVAYGDKTDLALWEEFWPKMGEHEKNAFEPYRKMLTKALENKDDLTRIRAARGDRKAQDELLEKKTEQEKPSGLLQNKQFFVGGVVLIALILIYAILRFKNRK